MTLATSLFVFAIVYLLLRSRHGLALTAIRDSEPASASLGVNTFRTKFIIYVATAACTGLIGGLIFLQKLRISPEAGFSINDWTVVVIFMVVIGGIGTLEGPFIGMLVYIVLRELLADYGTYYLDPAGRSRHRHHVEGADGNLGLGDPPLRLAAVSGRPAAEACAAGRRSVQAIGARHAALAAALPVARAKRDRPTDRRTRPGARAALCRARRSGGRGAANSAKLPRRTCSMPASPASCCRERSAATVSVSTPGTR